MRTARRVIACLLFILSGALLPAQQAPAPAGGSTDSDVTIIGRDDAIIPVPEPESVDEELVLPALNLDPPPVVLVPPVDPPVGALPALPDPSLLLPLAEDK